MADDDKKLVNDEGDEFGHSLPLPDEVKIDHANDLPPDQAAAADLVRQRVEAAYEGTDQRAPNFIEEAIETTEIEAAEPQTPLSKHQQFVYDLAASGRPLRDINQAWHEYYAGLTDADKHQVWAEFNEAHLKASKLIPALATSADAEAAKTKAPITPRRRRQPGPVEKTVVHHGKRLVKKAAAKVPERHRQPLKSVAFGLSIGLVFLFIFMFTFFNERFIAPFIQPSRTVNNAQVITASGPVSTKPEIVIPKINVQIPVIYWVTGTDDKSVEAGLDNGVVHYADTAQPGENGNAVIVGHSASNIFNKGRYKFAFSNLRKLDSGDTFYIQKDGVRYTYQVYKKKVVRPNDVSVLAPQKDAAAVVTLITCDPPGTSSNRLIIMGKQISPDPAANSGQTTDNKSAQEQTVILPGNAPSLWSRLVGWFKGD